MSSPASSHLTVPYLSTYLVLLTCCVPYAALRPIHWYTHCLIPLCNTALGSASYGLPSKTGLHTEGVPMPCLLSGIVLAEDRVLPSAPRMLLLGLLASSRRNSSPLLPAGEGYTPPPHINFDIVVTCGKGFEVHCASPWCHPFLPQWRKERCLL
jgi:hypothetical protein